MVKKIEHLEEKTRLQEEELQANQGKKIKDPKERATYLSQIESLSRMTTELKEENEVLLDQVTELEEGSNEVKKKLIEVTEDLESKINDNNKLERLRKTYETKLKEYDKDIIETEEELEILILDNEKFENIAKKYQGENEEIIEKCRRKNVLLTKMKILLREKNIDLSDLKKIKIKTFRPPELDNENTKRDFSDVKSMLQSSSVWDEDDIELREFEEDLDYTSDEADEGVIVDENEKTSIKDQRRQLKDLDMSKSENMHNMIPKGMKKSELAFITKKKEAEYKEKIAKLEGENDQLNGENAKVSNEMLSIKKKYRTEIAEKDAHITKLEQVTVRNLMKSTRIHTEEIKNLKETIEKKTKHIKEFKRRIDIRIRKLEEERKDFLIEKEKFIQRTVDQDGKFKRGRMGYGNIKNLVNELFELRLKYKKASTEREKLLRECNQQRRVIRGDRKELRILKNKRNLSDDRIRKLEKEIRSVKDEKDSSELEKLEEDFKMEKNKLMKKIISLTTKLKSAQNLAKLNSQKSLMNSNIFTPVRFRPRPPGFKPYFMSPLSKKKDGKMDGGDQDKVSDKRIERVKAFKRPTLARMQSTGRFFW